jgi:hypothetical protein
MARGKYQENGEDVWRTPDNSWLEMEVMEEEDDRGGIFYVNALVREGEGKEQDEEDPVWGPTQQDDPITTEGVEEANGREPPRPRRRAK